MGRELTFANPKIIEMVNDFFVPLALDDWYQRRRQDLEGDFFRHVVNQGPQKGQVGGSRQGIYALSADGRLLNYRNHQDPVVMRRFLVDALEAWREILPAERAKGAMKVEPLPAVDARYSPALPKGALIVNTYARILDREGGFFCQGTCKSIGGQRAGRDRLWIRADEWQALMPEGAKKGQEIAVPAKLLYRLVRYNLVDSTRGEPPNWSRAEVRRADLKLVVTDVSAGEVRLTLTGTVLMATSADVKTAKRGYDAALHGDIRYDPAKRVLTRFNVTAVGDHWGEWEYNLGARPGRMPFGVAFELGDPARPADRLPPQAVREGANYWNTER